MSKHPQTINTAREVSSVSADDIPEWVFGCEEPLVLKGLVKDWPLTKLGQESPNKQIEYLREHYAGQPSLVYKSDAIENRLLAFNNDITGLNFEITKGSLSELLDDLQAAVDTPEQLAPIRYIASNVVDYYFPSLRDQNDLNFDSAYFSQQPLEGGDPLVGIWIGNQAITACHYDAQQNIACCLAGERKFTLFPPTQIENLYPGPLQINPGGQAITVIDFDRPDFDKYPKFKEALKQCLEVTLQPGDALFLPSMWWHQVASMSPFNLMINYWWNSFPKSQGQAYAAFEHALLSLRHRSTAEKSAWKTIFDYYIFGETDNAVAHLPNDVHGPLGPLKEPAIRQLRAQILNKLNR